MGDITLTIAKGRINELHRRVVNNDPATSGIILVLLKAAEADTALEDYADLAALLAAAGNTEADFTNYARKVLTDTDLAATVSVDTGANTQWVDLPDVVWVSAGGATNNTLVKIIPCYAPDVAGADSTLIPMIAADFAGTTTGNDLTAVFGINGYYSANS